MKTYDSTILYHLEKVHVVVGASSSMFIGSLAHIVEVRRPLTSEIHVLEVNEIKFKIKKLIMLLAHTRLYSSLWDQIKATQIEDALMCKIVEKAKKSKKIMNSKLM